MKLKYFGHACFSLAFEGGPTLVIDPFDASVTYPPCSVPCDGALISHNHFDHNHISSLPGEFEVISAPGEYQLGAARISAMESFHDPKGGALRGRNLLFVIECEGLRFAHLGDLGHMPDARQTEFLKNLDVLMLPIGGVYTIDTPQAEELIEILRPRHSIAMHYKTPAYNCAMTTCEQFEKDTGAARLPREIEITKDKLAELPAVMILDYK